MGKIQDFIIANNIKPKECLYHTNRSAKNARGEPTGKIRVLATKDNVARVEYVCPECMHEADAEQEWKRPFSVKCSKCGFVMKMPKLKDEIKRDKKRQKT